MPRDDDDEAFIVELVERIGACRSGLKGSSASWGDAFSCLAILPPLGRAARSAEPVEGDERSAAEQERQMITDGAGDPAAKAPSRAFCPCRRAQAVADQPAFAAQPPASASYQRSWRAPCTLSERDRTRVGPPVRPRPSPVWSKSGAL